MLRCWDCKNIIVLPDIDNGMPTGLTGAVRTQEATCPRCGARYMLTVAKKPGYVKVERAPETEERREGERGWK